MRGTARLPRKGPMDSSQPRFLVNVTSAQADRDDDTQVYMPFKDWFEAEPGRYVWASAMALIALQAVLRGYMKFGGWFVVDDLAFVGRAETMPLWSREYLLSGWNGHFMPGAFLLVRFFNHFWPLNYVPVAIADLIVQAVVALLVLRLLTNLFGRRPAILVPFAIFLFSPMTLPAFLWWAASLNQLWGQLAMVLALLAHLRYHRTGSTAAGLFGVAAVAGGLLFSEKLVLMVPVILAMTVFYFTPGPPARRIVRAFRQHIVLWAAYGILTTAYAVYYLTQVPSPVNRPAIPVIAIQTVGTGFSHAVLPAIFGGPFTWQPLGVGGVAAPSDAVVIAIAATSALIVWYSMMRRVRASFAWMIIGCYEVVNALLLGVTRATWVGPLVGAEYRYHTDACMIFVVFGALAFLPVRGSFKAGVFQPLVPRRLAATEASAARRERSLPVPGAEAIAVGSLVCVVLVTSSISTLRYDPLWRNTVAPAYFANVRHDIRSVDHRLTIADAAIPGQVQPGLLFPANMTSYLFNGFSPRPRFLTRGEGASVLFIPDEQGHLRVADVEGFRNKPGREPGCGWRVGARARTIPLQLTTLPWLWTARIGYIASKDAQTTVTVGTVTSNVTVEAGLHHLYVIGEGAIDEVAFSGLTAGSLCTNDVVVGSIKPLPGTQP